MLEQDPERSTHPATLEAEANTELDLALGERGGERQRSARRIRPSTRQGSTGANSVHVKCGEAWRKTKQRTYFIVHAGEVRPVSEVESLRRDLHIRPFAHFVLPGQPGVEVVIIGAKTGVARRPNGPLIRCVIVTVNFSPCEQIKRMSAVVTENWRQLEP
jgi:hypothetical protein